MRHRLMLLLSYSCVQVRNLHLQASTVTEDITLGEPYSKSRFKSFSHQRNETYQHFTDGVQDQDQKFASNPITYFTQLCTSNGSKNPHWKEQVRNAQNATTVLSGVDCSDDPRPYVHSEYDYEFRSSTFSPQSIRHKGEYYGHPCVLPIPLGPHVPASTVTQVTNRCIMKFLDECNKVTSTFEAGQDFGEYKETLNGIRHPLDSLRKSILSYFGALTKARHKYRRDRPSLKKVLSDTYLEFHFGWQPLADDIAQYIADIGRFRFPIVPVHASASVPYEGDTGSNDLPLVFHPGRLKQSYRTTYRFTVKIKGAVKSGATNGQISRAASLQLTPEFWLPTAWDLLPYSWMADYFINIGDIIKAATFCYGKIAWSSISTRDEATAETDNVNVVPPSPPNGYRLIVNNNSFGGGRAKVFRKVITRNIVNQATLIPEVQFSIPTSKYAYFNMAAVFLQRANPLVPFF